MQAIENSFLFINFNQTWRVIFEFIIRNLRNTILVLTKNPWEIIEDLLDNVLLPCFRTKPLLKMSLCKKIFLRSSLHSKILHRLCHLQRKTRSIRVNHRPNR